MTEEKTLKNQVLENMASGERRVIWVTGGKGGTGKSTFARGLLDLLLASGLNVMAVDGDPENAQLHRYYKDMGAGVIRTKLKARNGGDVILNEMEEQEPQIILADVAAGGSQILVKLEDETGFLSDAAEMGYQFTVATVISPIMDSVNMLNESMVTTKGHNVQHVAVKNLHFGSTDEFELLDESKTKQRFIESGGLFVEMRDLFGQTYRAVDKGSLPFQMALKKESGLPRGDRKRVQRWLTQLEDQVRTTDSRLGV